MGLYKGYVATKGKKCLEKLKGRTDWKTFDEVKDLNGYGGILEDDTILIDIDEAEQAEILMNIVEGLQLNCKVYQTSRGKHFLFKNHAVNRNRTHIPLAVGLVADIKVGSRLSYEIIKIDGEERFCEWDIEDGEEYDELPKFLLPVRTTADFLDMAAGDGRNQALFNYILTLQSNELSVEDIRETIRIINKYVLKDPLSDDELETVLRDEAFQKPIFFIGKEFQFDVFGNYLINNHHIVRIDGQLHIYKDGIYCNDLKAITNTIRSYIPNIRKNQKNEVIDYMLDMAQEKKVSDARYIAFNNGVYDIIKDELYPFAPGIVVTNKIPWDYNTNAYNELADVTLNKLSCGDPAIRSLLEECIGYCFYRENTYNKAFILTGEKANGKSTFLHVVKAILGDNNISSMDLKNIGDRFSKATLFNKLANIGDDISDEFIPDTSLFKKITDGGRIQVERKGQDPFEFNPYAKLLFSANDIPRMKDKTGAVLRRLVIIPFNARFDENDPDYNPNIKTELIEQSSIEYLITLGIAGLKRVISTNKFTASNKVEAEKEAYNLENNPITAFIKDQGEDMIVNQPTKDVYKRYQLFCADNGFQPGSNITFSKNVNRVMQTQTIQKKINGKKYMIFVQV